jgi:hypothetical protein
MFWMRAGSSTNVVRIAALWLPIALVYCVLTMFALKRCKMDRLSWSLEICGFCVGAFPVVSGLWPTYFMRLDLAVIFVAIQCSILGVAMLIRYFLFGPKKQ